jgi:hypothetical protein
MKSPIEAGPDDIAAGGLLFLYEVIEMTPTAQPRCLCVR